MRRASEAQEVPMKGKRSCLPKDTHKAGHHYQNKKRGPKPSRKSSYYGK